MRFSLLFFFVFFCFRWSQSGSVAPPNYQFQCHCPPPTPFLLLLKNASSCVAFSLSPFPIRSIRRNETFACFWLLQVGCGMTTVDFLVTVDAFPNPDDKVRTTSFKVLKFAFASFNSIQLILRFDFHLHACLVFCRFKEVAMPVML